MFLQGYTLHGKWRQSIAKIVFAEVFITHCLYLILLINAWKFHPWELNMGVVASQGLDFFIQ